MGTHALEPRGRPLETWVAWYTAWASVSFAGVALLTPGVVRILPPLVGAALSMALAPAYARRATPLSSVLVTVGAAFVSTATLVWLAKLPWRAGLSFSQAGGTERPTAWLLTTTSWCFGLGLLATGRLVVQAGRRGDRLGVWGYRLASLLPVISFAGFVLVGAFQVGGDRSPAMVHNLAAWAAMGSFWAGMVATPWLPETSRALRSFSGVAAVVVIATWLPNGLRFLGVTHSSPISTLYMELLVFPLSFVWLGWIAKEWGESPGAS